VRYRAQPQEPSGSRSAELQPESSLEHNIDTSIHAVNRRVDYLSADDGVVLSDRVKQLRVAKQLTQAQLAERVGVKQPSIAAIESGKTRMLSAKMLMGLAKALGEDPDYIRTGRRAAGAPESDENYRRLVALYNSLTPQSRALWLEVGQSLVHPARAQVVHNADAAVNLTDTRRAQAMQEVRNQLREMLATHGPDTVARILANYKSAASEQAAKPRKGGKQKA
jgi:transcriptional regulator with XRE-family HTH domain